MAMQAVALHDEAMAAIQLVGELQRSAPECSMLVISRSSDGELIRPDRFERAH